MRHSGVKRENNLSMKCAEAELQIIDVLASGKPGRVPADLSEHLNSCSSCAVLFRECSTGFSSLAEGRKSHIEPGFYDRLIVTELQNRSSSHNLTAVRRVMRYSPTIAAAAASVILGIWIGSRLISPSQSGFSIGSFSGVADGNSYIQNYSSDMHPEDEITVVLEGYLTVNENTVGYDTE